MLRGAREEDAEAPAAPTVIGQNSPFPALWRDEILNILFVVVRIQVFLKVGFFARSFRIGILNYFYHLQCNPVTDSEIA